MAVQQHASSVGVLYCYETYQVTCDIVPFDRDWDLYQVPYPSLSS